jgi:hypothetical protein
MAKQRIFHGGTVDVVTPEEMAEILASQQPNLIIGMGGSEIEEVQPDLPVKGTLTQLTSFNRGDGSDNFVVSAAAFIQLCLHNPRRIAGTVQNIGANPCYFYLATLAKLTNTQFGAVSQVAVGYINGGGSGNWDFKLSNEVWKGPVCVYSPLGTTLVWGEH